MWLACCAGSVVTVTGCFEKVKHRHAVAAWRYEIRKVTRSGSVHHTQCCAFAALRMPSYEWRPVSRNTQKSRRLTTVNQLWKAGICLHDIWPQRWGCNTFMDGHLCLLKIKRHDSPHWWPAEWVPWRESCWLVWAEGTWHRPLEDLQNPDSQICLFQP